MPRVTIDRDGCISCGTCLVECPDVFEEDPSDAKSRVVEQYRDGADPAEGTVPDGLAECVRRASDACPVAVIAVE